MQLEFVYINEYLIPDKEQMKWTLEPVVVVLTNKQAYLRVTSNQHVYLVRYIRCPDRLHISNVSMLKVKYHQKRTPVVCVARSFYRKIRIRRIRQSCPKKSDSFTSAKHTEENVRQAFQTYLPFCPRHRNVYFFFPFLPWSLFNSQHTRAHLHKLRIITSLNRGNLSNVERILQCFAFDHVSHIFNR